MKKQLFAAALATLMAGGMISPASAQDAPPPPPGGGMMRADTNHDGVITRDEVLADADQRFARMDTNHDGKIDQAERDAMMAQRGGGQGRGGRMGGRADTNGDGVISLDEQRAQATQRFDMVDANHDGKIDQAEQDSMRQRMMSMRGNRGPQGDGPPPPPPADAPPAPNGN